jgi:hypothetical protein
MKKCYLLFALVSILFVFKVHAQSWQPVGPNDDNQATLYPSQGMSMALNGNGIPYIVFRDTYLNDHKVTVRKFEGGVWTNVGMPLFSEGSVSYTDIDFDSGNTPYVAYKDEAQSSKATVKKFDGANWITVGAPGFTEVAVGAVFLAIDGNNIPYVMYMAASNGDIYVKKFDGSNWISVGTTGFPAAHEAAMAIDGNNMPYLIYSDQSNSGKATVKRFDGVNWVTVGAAGFSTGAISFASIAVTPANNPYITYQDGNAVILRRLNGTTWQTTNTINGARQPSMALDINGRPYVVYEDDAAQMVTVRRFTGTGWATVGTNPTGIGASAVPTITVDANNTPYIAYKDNSLVSRDIVKKFDGASWTTLGITGFTPHFAGTLSIKIDGNNTPYVLYEDGANSNKASVKKFDGSAWVDVGMAGFSNESINHSALAIDATGAPYVVYIESAGHDVFVEKYDGGNWIDIGAVVGHSSSGSLGHTTSSTIAIDGNNMPYVVYSDADNGNKATAKRFDGTNWVTVGTTGFSAGAASDITIAFTSNGTPYVAYQDLSNGNRITVKQFDGAAWVTVGTEAFTGNADYASLAIDGNNIPYVAFQDESNGDKATVKRFNGSAWEDVGTSGFSTAHAGPLSISCNTNGTPYVAYADESNQGKVTVKKFDGGNWVTVGTEGFTASYAEWLSMAIGPNGIPIVVYSNGGAFAKSIIETPLPLSFLEFKGRLINNEALITWKTENEAHTLEFIVERSIDGRNYSSIGTVAALNTPGAHQYNFTDRNIDLPGAAVVYYRLKQKDIDSRFTYSRIVTLPVHQTQSTVLFYPNPVKGEAGVTITVDKPEKVQVRIVDNYGNTLQLQQLNVSAGSNALSINMSGFVKGIYYLQVKSNSLNKQFRIVKQ